MNITNLAVLFTPFIAAVIAQGIKIFLKQKGKSKRLKEYFSFTYAGMPSGHTALVISTISIIGFTQGIDSALFGFSFIFAAVIINDALRLRRYLGQHGEVLNDLVRDLKEEEMLNKRYPTLLERIGHTKFEIIIGALIGFLTSWIMWLIIK